jgi:hypothetical protein
MLRYQLVIRRRHREQSIAKDVGFFGTRLLYDSSDLCNHGGPIPESTELAIAENKIPA